MYADLARRHKRKAIVKGAAHGALALSGLAGATAGMLSLGHQHHEDTPLVIALASLSGLGALGSGAAAVRGVAKHLSAYRHFSSAARAHEQDGHSQGRP
jgi:hypothetical protein